MSAEVLGVAKVLSKPLNDIYEAGKSRFAGRLKNAKASNNVNRLYKHISSVGKVKTIWQIDKSVDLKKFYYPPKLVIDGELESISSIKKLPNENNIVIQGIVGQGKSIFMRYLCCQELRIGERVPIFFELRRIGVGESLKENLYEILSAYGFEINDDVFEFLCDSGKIVLLLDGFDEISSDKVSHIIKELELLIEKHQNLKVIISSRPDSGIEKSAKFSLYKLAPVSNQDLRGFLNKLIGSSDRADEIIDAVNTSETEIKSLLTTPLMITLLVILYKAEQKIPNQLSDFYESLFPTLLYRHDRSKPGYVRERSSKVNERKLQQAFEAFCFLTRSKQLSIISHEDMYRNIERALDIARANCDSSEFIEDITKVTNLIVEEGYKYYFIHKSVQEFHAANYIRSRSDIAVEKFYNSMRYKNWSEWRQEILFLSQIDEYRYNKYLCVPILQEFFNRCNVDLNDFKGLTDDIKSSILKGYEILIDLNNIVDNEVDDDFVFSIYGFKHNSIMTGYIVDDFQFKVMRRLFGLINNQPGFQVKLGYVLPMLTEDNAISDFDEDDELDDLDELDELADNNVVVCDGEELQRHYVFSLYALFNYHNVLEVAKSIVNEEFLSLYKEYRVIKGYIENENKNDDLMML